MIASMRSMSDPELAGEVLTVIRKLAQAGMTMIVVTHDLPEEPEFPVSRTRMRLPWSSDRGIDAGIGPWA